MEAVNLVKNLCYSVENQARYVCRNISDDDARWRPDNGCPAIGWIVGHILVNQDIIINHRLCGNPLAFEDLVEHFGFATSGDFPEPFTLDDLFSKFKHLTGEIVKVIESKDESWLDGMFDTSGFPPNWEGKSIGKGFILAFNHGITHAGQILEVKRMLGKGAWGF